MGISCGNEKTRIGSAIGRELPLRGRLFLLHFMTGCTERFFAALEAARFACRATGDIEDDFAVVFAAIGACTVRLAERTAFATDGTRGDQSVMASAFCGLRPVAAHSDNHRQHHTSYPWHLQCRYGERPLEVAALSYYGNPYCCLTSSTTSNFRSVFWTPRFRL